MQQEEIESEIRRRRELRPFEPFIIELTSGERVEVDDPEAVGFGGGAAGFITAEGEPIDFDCSEVVRIFGGPAVLTS